MRIGMKVVKADNDWVTDEINSNLGNPGGWSAAKPYLSPSGIYSICTRAAAYRLLGHRGKINAQSIRRMDNGTFMHKRWTEYFQKSKYYSDADTRLETERMHGYLDILLTEFGKGVIGELKSINSRGWAALPPIGTPEINAKKLTLRHPAYMAQLLTYLKYFPADKGFFLFENKDTQEFRVYHINRDDALQGILTQKSELALDSVLIGALPERDFDEAADPVCKMCAHRSICWRGVDADIVQERLNLMGSAK